MILQEEGAIRSLNRQIVRRTLTLDVRPLLLTGDVKVQLFDRKISKDVSAVVREPTGGVRNCQVLAAFVSTATLIQVEAFYPRMLKGPLR
jgi:glutamate formiminotransferase